MGATFSSPPTETLLLKIKEYSKLTRVPVREHQRDFMRFRNLWWDITVSSLLLNEETAGSQPDFVRVEVFLGFHCSPELSLSTVISLEILDHTGLYTVFQCESSRSRNPTVHAAGRFLLLRVPRRELEASSCVRRRDDSFYVRCTIKEQPGFLENWFTPKFDDSGNVAMCHTHTFENLSQLKAALLGRECAHSTHLGIGGSMWYLKLCPGLAAVHLARATRENDETRTTAEFFFILEGAVNVRSEKMTHTFDLDNPECGFAYQPPEETGRRAGNEGAVNVVQSEKMTHTFHRDSPDFAYQPPEEEPGRRAGNEGAVNVVQSENMRQYMFHRGSLFSWQYLSEEELRPTSTDCLVVRCCIKVIPLVATPTESELTSLLSAMHS